MKLKAEKCNASIPSSNGQISGVEDEREESIKVYFILLRIWSLFKAPD